MSYTRQNFVKGQVLEHTHLNNMEDGIMEALGGSVYATAFHDEEDLIYNRVVNDIDGRTVTLVLGADTHAKDATRYAYGKVMRKLGERLNADAIVHLGDMINEDQPVREIAKEIHYANSRERLLNFVNELKSDSIPVLYAIGHHEAYPWIHANGTMWNYELTIPVDGDYNFPLEKVSGICNRFNRGLVKHVDDNDTSNYYVDFDMQKLRCIFINSVTNFVSFSDTTIAWVSEVLNSTPDNYKVSFFAHAPNIKEANHRTQTAIANGPELVTIMNNYVNNGGTILGYFHGHTHGDNIVKTNDMKFHLISLACGQPSEYNGSGIAIPSLGNYDTPPRVEGTYTEYAYDIVNIHTDTNIINMYRFGAGKSRQITPTGFGEMPNSEVVVPSGATDTLDNLCGRTIWHDYASVDVNSTPATILTDSTRVNRIGAYFIKVPNGMSLSCASGYLMNITEHTSPTAESYTQKISGWVSSYTPTVDTYIFIHVRAEGNASATGSPSVVGNEDAYKSVSVTLRGASSLSSSQDGDVYIITAA